MSALHEIQVQRPNVTCDPKGQGSFSKVPEQQHKRFPSSVPQEGRTDGCSNPPGAKRSRILAAAFQCMTAGGQIFHKVTAV